MPNKNKQKRKNRARRNRRDTGENPRPTNLNPWRHSVANIAIVDAKSVIITPSVLFTQIVLQEMDIAVDPSQYQIALKSIHLYGAIPTENNTGIVALQPANLIEKDHSRSVFSRRGTQSRRAYLKFIFPKVEQNIVQPATRDDLYWGSMLGTKGAYARIFVKWRHAKAIQTLDADWVNRALGFNQLSLDDGVSGEEEEPEIDSPDCYDREQNMQAN